MDRLMHHVALSVLVLLGAVFGRDLPGSGAFATFGSAISWAGILIVFSALALLAAAGLWMTSDT